MSTQPTHKRLSSGLQSLADASPEYELAPIGIASMHKQAEKLAEYGRNGDIYIVHAAEGETVIPMEVLNANPQIKALLFNQMKDMGLDPQEFVVGNELNSINPDTGLPEFFFSSIFRSVKKAAKSVFKAVKKLAPIAIPIALTMFGLPIAGFGAGSFGAAALGGGLGSLAGGGSLKDAFKAAVISGGTTALMGGVKGAMGGPGSSFSKGAMNTFNPVNAPSPGLQFDRLTSGDSQQLLNFIGTSPADQNFNPMGLGAADPKEVAFNRNLNTDAMVAGPGAPSASNAQVSNTNFTLGNQRPLASSLLDSPANPLSSGNPLAAAPGSINSINPGTLAQQSLFDNAAKAAQEAASPKFTPSSLFDYATGGPKFTRADLVNINPSLGNIQGGAAMADSALKTVNPGMLRTYGPLAAAGGLGAYAMGAFDPPPVEEVTQEDLVGYVGGDLSGDNQLYAANPDQYKIPTDPYQFPTYTPSQVRVPSSRFAGGLQMRPVGGGSQPSFMANKGGYFTKDRREDQLPQFAGYVEGPGTPTSDSIPGYLSDGEFVFNAQSVKGADPSGQGNREAGASNLYNMMRNLQMRA